MVSWMELEKEQEQVPKNEFQHKFDLLNQINVQGLIDNLRKLINKYNMNGGSTDEYQSIQNLLKQITNIKEGYSDLNKNIEAFTTPQGPSLVDLLNNNGTLQQQIIQLEKLSKSMDSDVDTAIVRDEQLRSKNTNISREQLFIIGRPIRKGLIPYLWVLSVLFIGVALIIFRMTTPNISFGADTTGTTLLGTLYSFFSNYYIFLSIIGASLIVILFLSLKIAGVIGN